MSLETATFGAGCFWGVEAAYRMQPGVIKTLAGYAGGKTNNPTYRGVASGSTGHVEAIQVTFNPEVVSYQRLLDIFWQIHDPTLANRQGNDAGPQYQAVIFYHNRHQHQQAEASKETLVLSGQYSRPIATLIKPLDKFWPAEEEHQRYLEKHPGGYCHINLNQIR